MEPPTDPELASRLARACATSLDGASLHARSAPLLLELSGARSVLVLREDGDDLLLLAGAGAALPIPPDAPAVGAAADSSGTVALPEEWRTAGVGRAEARRVGPDTLLLLAWAAGASPLPATELAVDVLVLAEQRVHTDGELRDLAARVDNAQQLAGMGDYDWHIASDINRWSDQLYRIYGYEPQSFNASYERFLALIHPDDRERISAIHQRAYDTGEPYQMIERIVRPDGNVRYLSSNGQVVRDAEGRPTRMRGTCVDITDRVLAEKERERSAARFRGLVESSPEAILLHDGGRIVQANGRAEELLGGDPRGHLISRILSPRTGPDGRAVESPGLDGRTRLLDVTTARLNRLEEAGLVAVFLSDASPRLAREELVARLREIQVRKKQALEINDNVVQGLTAALLALEGGGDVGSYLRATLDSARRMMSDWLEPLYGLDATGGDGGSREELGAGDLVRTAPARLAPHDFPSVAEPPAEVPRAAPAGRAAAPKVLVVDDCEDIRMLLRLRLSATQAYEVVGEASDGRQAVELARLLRPDVVLLDLAMPVMDGLEALPLIREAVPEVGVIVLSGFDRGAMEHRAMAAGADRYLEKGKVVAEIVGAVEEVLAARAGVG